MKTLRKMGLPTREQLLEILAFFYIDYIDEYSMTFVHNTCPFTFDFPNVSCKYLCGRFKDLTRTTRSTSLESVPCPCHLGGPKQSMKRLGRLLRREGFIS